MRSATHSVALGHAWMVEDRDAAHRQLLHQPPGGLVGRRRPGDDAVEPGWAEAMGQRQPRGFLGQALALEAGGDAPADLDGGGEVGFERRGFDAGDADHALAAQFHHPEAVAVGGAIGGDAPAPIVALGAVMDVGEEAHRSRVAIDGEEAVEVVGQPPGAERDAGAVERDRVGPGRRSVARLSPNAPRH
jgi:hypothetical protein